ncbi:2-oxoglutarate dehydrogenase, E2 component, dihydrolipoamide succinyltransferase [uncultured Amnibacterium sp.]|uniref:2-oxoglutarate dehydrogenase, E2 component, dihydrolipoamide succinyltransferase n=1 Tax=uncultured Amnibacterium sp. TaxID=1631851 RepID=UPI0035CC5B0E
MSESITLPALGESVTEGTVTRWLKQVGDQVEVDEPLLEVSTDKVDTEIPSPIAGVIEEILVQEDETVEVGAALVRIGDGSGSGTDSGSDEQTQAPEPEEAEPAPIDSSPQPAPEQVQQDEPQQSGDAGTSYTGPSPETESAAPEAQPANEQQAQPAKEQQAQPAPQPAAGAQTDVPSTDAPVGTDAASGSAAGEAPAAPPAPAQPEPAPAATVPSPPAPAPAPAAPTPSAPESSPPAGAHASAPYVTPIVRKLAHDRGVDLTQLQGSGIGGRIRKEDVLAAAEAAAQPAAPAEAPTPAAGSVPAREPSPLRGTTVKMSRLRKVVAERAVVSMQSSAQLTTVVEADVTAVAAYRDSVKADFQAKTGLKLSFLPFFALAATEALQQYPIINATVDGDSIVYPDTENLSIAVDTERGLLTPVVRNAGSLSIAELAGQIADLASRTRENKLKPDELAGGTFTLTNTGSRGALFDTPLVFLPQVAILGTGIVARKPLVVKADGGEAIAIRSTVYLALSYDHRIVDGADAARFLVSVKQRLEAGDFAADLGI